MNVENVATHPDNREKAKVVPVDAYTVATMQLMREMHNMNMQLGVGNASLGSLENLGKHIEVRTCVHSKDGVNWVEREMKHNLVAYAIAEWNLKRERNVAMKWFKDFMEKAAVKNELKVLTKGGMKMSAED